MLGDFDRLQQVFRNLLSNAVSLRQKAAAFRSRWNVSIPTWKSASPTPARAFIDFLPFVFDRFRQAENATTRRHGSLGLGLAIVKQIVELHGGTVQANSPGEKQGPTFIVAVPLQVVHSPKQDRSHPQAESRQNQSYQAPDLTGVKVLVVDDEPDARDIVRRLLVGQHADVMVSASADEALEILESFTPTCCSATSACQTRTAISSFATSA